ncbi:pentatricopeptide repeat-containing protein At3g14730-like [Typha angustifolia]|uniref:pentatricopeptide repeat-containing protein At3g14730-like n=1 Tax=Typha angustifolia TaxID=59011 RepID=UPI003C2E1A83
MTVNLATLVFHLQLCGRLGHLSKARELHGYLITSGLHVSPFALTTLISLYSRLSLPSLSLAAFRSFPHQPPNLFAFNAAIAALASNSLPFSALQLFLRLRREAHEAPDEFTFPWTIKACAEIGSVQSLGMIHGGTVKVGLDEEVFTASALVHSYLKMGFVEEARKVFDELPVRDVVLWNAMVNGFAQMGLFGLALEYFYMMVGEGVVPSKFTATGILSVFTAMADLRNGRKMHAFVTKAGHDGEAAVGNALIDLYGKCHKVGDATKVFETMVDGERDIFSWNSMLSALQYSADHVGALRLFGRMRRLGLLPDAVTMAAVLPACAHMAALRLGRRFHSYMVTSGMASVMDVFASNALADMYAKSGALKDARLVFDKMPQRDVASWNIMIDGYASHGRGREAVELFNRMTMAEHLVPDEVTLLGTLAACSHAGLVDEGRGLLMRMREDFGVTPGPDHYACAADMLGRAGRLDEAKEVAEAAGDAGAGAWRVYLASCRTHGEAGRAKEAAKKIGDLEQEEVGSGGWVLLANACGSGGSYGEVEEVRGEMRRRGVRKAAPGCSWVEVGAEEGGGVHAFVSGDREHPAMEGIYEMLHRLVGRMRECGYVPDMGMERTLHGD